MRKGLQEWRHAPHIALTEEAEVGSPPPCKMLDNHNVRICRVDRFRVVDILCPTKVIKIVELCKESEGEVKN